MKKTMVSILLAQTALAQGMKPPINFERLAQQVYLTEVQTTDTTTLAATLAPLTPHENKRLARVIVEQHPEHFFDAQSLHTTTKPQAPHCSALNEAALFTVHNNTLSIKDRATGALLHEAPLLNGKITHLAANEHTTLYATGDDTGNITTWDMATHTAVNTKKYDTPPCSIHFMVTSCNEDKLVIGFPDHVEVIQSTSGALHASCAQGNAALRAFDNNGTLVAYQPQTLSDCLLRVHNLSAKKPCCTIQGSRSPITHIAFNSTSTQLVELRESTARVWSLKDGSSLLILQSGAYPIVSAHFIPNNNTLITCVSHTHGKATSINMWSVDGTQLHTMQLPYKECQVIPLSYTTLLISALGHGVFIVNPITQELLLELAGECTCAHPMLHAPSGTLITHEAEYATPGPHFGGDQTLQVWQLHSMATTIESAPLTTEEVFELLDLMATETNLIKRKKMIRAPQEALAAKNAPITAEQILNLAQEVATQGGMGVISMFAGIIRSFSGK